MSSADAPGSRRVTFYDVLGLPMDCTQAEIHAAYKVRLARCHRATACRQDNDSFCFFTEEEERQSKAALTILEKAFAVLANPKLRRWYDEQLLGAYAAAATAVLREKGGSRTQSDHHKHPHSTKESLYSLTDSLSTRQSWSGHNGTPQQQQQQQQSAEEDEGAREWENRNVTVEERTTADGAHVTIINGVGTDANSGALFAYKTMQFTSDPDTNKQRHHTEEHKPRERQQDDSAAASNADNKMDQSAAAADAAGANHPGEKEKKEQKAEKADNAKDQTPVIQDFDPGLLALLPNRLQDVLNQLLTAPLPAIAEPMATTTSVVVVDAPTGNPTSDAARPFHHHTNSNHNNNNNNSSSAVTLENSVYNRRASQNHFGGNPTSGGERTMPSSPATIAPPRRRFSVLSPVATGAAVQPMSPLAHTTTVFFSAL